MSSFWRRNVTSPSKVKAAKRRERALEMRIAGATLQMIADDAGVTRQSISKSIKTALADLAKQNRALAEELRAVTCARFDTAILALWPKVLDGDVAAIGEMRRIEDTRHRLLGTMLDPRYPGDQPNAPDITIIVEQARQKLGRIIDAQLEPPPKTK